jgi:putative flippase GtrA
MPIDLSPDAASQAGMALQAARLREPSGSIWMRLKGNSQFGQLARFVFVGVLNTAVGYLAYFFLVDYINYLAALAISHMIGVTHSYIWNRYWTFKSRQTKLVEFIRFNSVYALVFATNAAVLAAFVNVLHMDSRLGQLIALPIVTAISFAGHRRWSFKA